MGRKSNAVAGEAVLVRDGLADDLKWYLDRATAKYEASKAKFLKDVEINPAHAISWGESMLIDQHTYVCWMKAAKCLEERGREGLEKHADGLLDDILMNVSGGHSTSRLSNANHAVEQDARRTVYGRLKELLAGK